MVLLEKCEAAILLVPVRGTADLDQIPDGKCQSDLARREHGVDLRPPFLIRDGAVIEIENGRSQQHLPCFAGEWREGERAR